MACGLAFHLLLKIWRVISERWGNAANCGTSAAAGQSNALQRTGPRRGQAVSGERDITSS